MMVCEARQGFVVASPGVGNACAVVSRSPRGVGGKQAELGCLVMSSPGPVTGSEHGAIRRSQQCSITYGRPARGHAVIRAGLLAASERVTLRPVRANGPRPRAARTRRHS